MDERYAIPGYDRCFLVRSQGALGWEVIGPSGRTLKPARGSADKRPVFNLTRDDGRQQVLQLGRIVLLALCGPPPEGKTMALHADRDPWNNDPSNLRWGTAADNVADALAHGTHNFSVGHAYARRRRVDGPLRC